MTTTVRVLVEGNKKCEVKVVDAKGEDIPGDKAREVMPGSFTIVHIHGEQRVSVQETGGFL